MVLKIFDSIFFDGLNVFWLFLIVLFVKIIL